MNEINPDLVSKLKEILGEAKMEMKELYAMGTLYNKSLNGATDAAKRANFILGQQQGLVTAINKQMEKSKEGSKERIVLENITKQILETTNDIASTKNQLSADLLLKQTMIKTGLIGEHAEQAKNLRLLLEQGAITKGIYDMHVKRLQEDQKHTNQLREDLELQEAIAESVLEIKQEAESYKKSFTKILETGKAIGRSKELMGALMLSEGIKKIEAAHEGFETLRESGLSAGQAIQAQFKGLSLMSMLGLSDTKGALQGFAESYGSIGGISDDVVDQVGQMAHHFGIAGSEAAKLNASLSQMPGETSKTAADAAEMTGHLAEMQGIAPGKIMKDMAANTEAMALYGKGGAAAFGESAVELHKMGVEIGTAAKMADGLLDFENSINKQMEASVLLGRDINLDKARELALSGDLKGSTEEVLKNIGGQAELEKMNVIQKKALAEATGMTVEELTKAADAQAEHNKYFGEQAGIVDNVIGKTMEWGAATGGFLKENGLLLVSTMQFLKGTALGTKLASIAESAWNLTKKAGNALLNSSIILWVREKTVTIAGYIATGIATVAQGAWNLMKKAGNAIMESSVLAWIREKAVTVAGYIATGIAATAQGAWNIAKGVGNFLMSTSIGMWVAEKVQIIASTVAKYLNVGANTAIAASAGAAATATAASGTAAAGASGGFLAFGVALGAFGAAAAPAIPVILAIGAALLMASPAIYVLGEVIKTIAQVIGNVLMKALEMIPPTITAIADGFVTIFTSVANNIGAMLALGPALLMVGAGLGLVGAFGLTAMPVIGALIALAVVAPALVALGGALGSIFGGEGGEGDKEDKMQILIDEVRGLRSEMSKGGVVNMDGKKVGETLRLAMNTSGVR